MGPVIVRLGSELRNRWRAWVTMAVLLGLIGGAVLAVAAGARRTDTAYPRFLKEMRAYEVGVFQFIELEGFAAIDFDTIARLPQVVDSWRVRYFGDDRIGIEASTDPRWQTEVARVKILEGRRPDPEAIDEVTVSFLTVEAGYRVGGLLEIDLVDYTGKVPPTPVRLKIVGVHAAPGEFPPLLSENLSFKATRAFAERYASLTVPQGVGLRLKRGDADVPAFVRELEAVSGGDILFPVLQSDHADNVERSFHLQAIALWLLAGFTALGLLLVLGQSFRRQTTIEGTEYPTLRSLGMTYRQLAIVGIFRSAVIALAGAILAVAVTFLASPLFPTGIPRIAEPDPGFAADAAVLGIGPLAIIVLIVLITLPAAIASARRSGDAYGLAELQEPSAKPSVADGLSRAGLPTTMVAGVRLALEAGRGRTAVPVRSTIAGVALGIAALAAALAFDASLGHLLDTPEEYGLRWDAVAIAEFGTDATPLIEPALDSTGVADVQVGTYGVPLQVDGSRVDGLALVDGAGSGLLRIVEGREPAAPTEIVLGSNTLEAVGKNIGDRVQVSITGTAAREFRIVGVGITPPIGDQGNFGEGAFIEYAGLLHIFEEGPPPETLFIRFDEGVNHTKAIADLKTQLAPRSEGIVVEAPGLPADLVNFGRVQSLPVILAGLLAALASATLGHALVTAIRRRRRDLAVLKTMGFVRRQIHAAVAWQATTLALVAVALGIPLGIIGGRALWTLFANELGVEPSPQSAVLRNVLVIPATVVLANVIALAAGRWAARTRPAQVLRTE